MHVGLITYQTGHLKTWQLARTLLTKSFRVTLFSFPFKLRPGRVTAFDDRPHQLLDLDPEDFCRRYGVGYVPVEGWTDDFAPLLGTPGSADAPDVFLTCIAKIIPQSFIEGRTILNCHPGLLPQNRGVDAFKWCVINRWPFGVTLHVIDEQIDRGIVLARLRTPVFSNDQLRDVADRAYDFEVDLLGNFEHHLDKQSRGWAVGDDHPLSRKRVPDDLDARIEDIFLENRDAFVRLSTDLDQQPHPADAGETNDAAE